MLKIRSAIPVLAAKDSATSLPESTSFFQPDTHPCYVLKAVVFLATMPVTVKVSVDGAPPDETTPGLFAVLLLPPSRNPRCYSVTFSETTSRPMEAPTGVNQNPASGVPSQASLAKRAASSQPEASSSSVKRPRTDVDAVGPRDANMVGPRDAVVVGPRDAGIIPSEHVNAAQEDDCLPHANNTPAPAEDDSNPPDSPASVLSYVTLPKSKSNTRQPSPKASQVDQDLPSSSQTEPETIVSSPGPSPTPPRIEGPSPPSSLFTEGRQDIGPPDSSQTQPESPSPPPTVATTNRPCMPTNEPASSSQTEPISPTPPPTVAIPNRPRTPTDELALLLQTEPESPRGTGILASPIRLVTANQEDDGIPVEETQFVPGSDEDEEELRIPSPQQDQPSSSRGHPRHWTRTLRHPHDWTQTQVEEFYDRLMSLPG